MIGNILFFAAGLVITGVIAVPLLRSRDKRIYVLEKENLLFRESSALLRSRALQLAESVRVTAGAASPRGPMAASRSGQPAGMEKIESALGENSRTAAEIADKTRSVAAIASKTEEDVLHGFSLLEKNVKKMGDIKEKNSGVINGIILLSNKVNKIRDIVRMITTITEQTKVIAFNAALEAASAGDAGKRFAVVAGEVNRLADDIAVLTRQVREQAEEIQSSSSSLIVYSEEGSDRIAEGYKLIKDLEDVFKEIRAGAEITSNQAQTITVSTQKQQKSARRMSEAIAEASNEAKYFVSAAELAGAKAAGLAERALELEKIIESEEGAGQESYGA